MGSFLANWLCIVGKTRQLLVMTIELRQKVENLLGRFIPAFGNSVEKQRFTELVDDKFQEEFESPPRIAIIGPTGVGKSSTINALFGTNLPVGHTVATTQAVIETHILGPNGDLLIYDMPGIGEDLEADEAHISLYAEIIANSCDVAVWTLSAPDRRIAYDQLMLRDVVLAANEEIGSRLVIAVNKVDLLYPYNWIEGANLPSKAQAKHMNERMEDIRSKLTSVIPGLNSENIVPYSARKKYNLLELFNAMLAASITERAWVLNSRKHIDNFWDYVDPSLHPNDF